MSAKLIEKAKQKVADAKQRLLAIQEEMGRLQQEIAAWEDFVAKAELLSTGEETGKAASENGHHSGKVKVRRDSLAGLIARLILDRGRMPLHALVNHLKEMGKGEGVKDFSTAVNSALWRRKEDLFWKMGKDYDLQTREIEFVD